MNRLTIAWLVLIAVAALALLFRETLSDTANVWIWCTTVPAFIILIIIWLYSKRQKKNIYK